MSRVFGLMRTRTSTNDLMDFLDGRHRVVEHLSLTEVIRELGTESFDLESVDRHLGVSVSSLIPRNGVRTGRR